MTQYSDRCKYKVLSPYKVFNIFAVAVMADENTSRFMGGAHLLWVPWKRPSTHLKKKLTISLLRECFYPLSMNEVKNQKHLLRGRV